MKSTKELFVGAACVALATCAFAQAKPIPATAVGASQGVYADKIVIGRSGSMSGVNARQGNAVDIGIRAAFDEKNRQGGVYGEKLELETIDDGYSPEVAAQNVERLIKDTGVMAFIGFNGTPIFNKVLPLLDAAKIPFLLSTSGSAQRDPNVTPSRYFFNTRNSNADDAEGINAYLGTIGDTTVAIIYDDGAYGKAALAEFQKSAKKRGITITAAVPMKQTEQNADSIVRSLMEAGGSTAHNIVTLMIDIPTGKAIRAIRAYDPQNTRRIFTITSTGEAERELTAKEIEGVIVSQTTPPLTGDGDPNLQCKDLVNLPSSPDGNCAVLRFRGVMDHYAPGFKDSVQAFEGYTAAKILIEGLTDAGPKPTREGLVNALEKFHRRVIDGFVYSYDTPMHEGAHYNELTQFGRNFTKTY
jgi:branched-chain amino acid transport system substrate-binding protein